METEIIQITAAGIICAVLAITLKKHSPEFAVLISLAASVFIFYLLFPQLRDAVNILTQISGSVNTDSNYVPVVLRIVGIAYIAEFGAQLCVDAGETGIASKVELSGKVLIMAASAPVLLGLIGLINRVMPG
jgi:stage III sporulation protein AD